MEPPNQSAKRIERETHLIKEAVADLFAKWADIEDQHAVVLETIIGETNVAFRVYFAPSATETRFAIVSAAVRGFCENHLEIKEPEYAARLVSAWDRISSGVGRLKNTRNAVAHGHIGHIVTLRKTHVRWISPKYDVSKFPASGQIHGLTASDINGCATALLKYGEHVHKFVSILSGILGKHSWPWPQILLELEANLTTGAPQSGAPSQQEP